jgi:hypothetical protein
MKLFFFSKTNGFDLEALAYRVKELVSVVDKNVFNKTTPHSGGEEFVKRDGKTNRKSDFFGLLCNSLRFVSVHNHDVAAALVSTLNNFSGFSAAPRSINNFHDGRSSKVLDMKKERCA